MSAETSRPAFSPEQTWALVFFGLVQFMVFVIMTTHYDVGWGNFPWHLYDEVIRSMLELIVLLGLLTWFIVPAHHRRFALTALLTVVMGTTVCYMGWVQVFDAALDHLCDRDSALEVAGQALLRGDFPYAEVTFLGLPLSPLTTPILMALPAVALFGEAELMMPFVLLAMFLLLAWQHRRTACPLPLSVIALMVFFSPLAIEETLLGRDLLWAGPWLLAALFLLERDRPITASALFGVGVCSRTALLFLLPLWCVHLVRSRDQRVAGHALLALTLTIVALELPFFLWSPLQFLDAPLMISTSKISNQAQSLPSMQGAALNAILPDSAARVSVVIAALLALSAWLGMRVANVPQLALAMAAVLGVSFVFTAGMMRMEYLCWPAIFLLGAVMGEKAREKPLPAGGRPG